MGEGTTAHHDDERRLASIAALDHPVRRDLYRLLTASGEWTSRDQAAAATGRPRSVAAFHLDALAEAGVLEVRYERLGGRQGPGAGRPAKLYRAVSGEVSVSVPDRRYDLAGSILAAAVDEAVSSGEPVSECLASVAVDRGRSAVVGTGSTASVEEALRGQLGRFGYEPVESGDGGMVLRNCPFRRLAEAHPDVVCGMNLGFVTGLIEGVGATQQWIARLDPSPGTCCVRVVARRDG